MKKLAFFFFLVTLVISLISLDNVLSKEQSSEKSATKQSKKESQTKKVKKQTNISGLGIFKIGKTEIAIIDDLEKELTTKLVVTSDSYELVKAKGKSNLIFQLVPKNKTGYDQFSICPDVKEYLIPVYNIADMQIENLKLKFYKDVLFEISCDSTERLEEALKLKYGEPDMEVEKKSISCIYKYTGNKVTYEDKTFTSTWENGNINANNYIMFWHNDQCEERFLRTFYIRDSKTSEIISKCEKEIIDQNKIAEKQKREKKLKDL